VFWIFVHLEVLKKMPAAADNSFAVRESRRRRENLDTALRPYDGLVTPYGVIDFIRRKNYQWE